MINHVKTCEREKLELSHRGAATLVLDLKNKDRQKNVIDGHIVRVENIRNCIHKIWICEQE